MDDMAAVGTGGRIRFWVADEVAPRVAADVVEVLGADNRVHTLDLQAEKPTHIVCLPASYESLRGHAKMGIQLVTPLWAVRSATEGKWHPEEGYSPDPSKFFSGLVVYLDDYPTNIKVVYGGLITHYGGQISKQLTKYCSHIITDRAVEDLAKALPVVDEAPIQIYPLKWLDECIEQKQLISGEQLRPASSRPMGNASHSPTKLDKRDMDANHRRKMLQLSKGYPGSSKCLADCGFVLASDYPRSTRSGLVDIIDRHGGRVFLTVEDACNVCASSSVYFVCPFLEAANDYNSAVKDVSEFFVLMSVEAQQRIEMKLIDEVDLPAEVAFVQELRKPMRYWGPIDNFVDCVICVSGYNDDGALTRQILRRVIERIGGCYVGPLMMNRTTHLIVGDDSSEKLQRARQWVDAGVSLHIVSLQWLLACVQSWARVDEAAFRWKTPVPHLAQEVIAPSTIQNNITPARSVTRGGGDGDLFNSPLAASQFQYDVDSVPTPEFPDIERTPASQTQLEGEKTPQPGRSSELGKRTREPLSPITNLTTFPSPKKPAVHDLDNDIAQEDGNLPGQAAAMEEMERSVPNETAYRRFMLSAAGAEQKEELGEVVTNLGAEISDTIGDYDDECTHIILNELKRTPKFLFGCAGGKWILRPEYIEHCKQAGCWLPEEGFEWSPPKGENDVDPKTGLWLGAPRTWRLAAAADQGPYSGMQISVVGKTVPPRDQLERLVQVGKGSILSLEEIVAPDDPDGTRVVVAKEATKSTHDALTLARSTGCVLVKPTFLLDLISTKTRPDPAEPKYVVPL